MYALTCASSKARLIADYAIRTISDGVAGANNADIDDALICATAQRYGARLITSDAHFENVPGVTLL